MSDEYHVIGAENSPYSVKVRSYFRYKGLPHRWSTRAEAAEEFQRHARLPLVPLVVTPDGQGMQDSTPIIDAMEEAYAQSSVHPEDPIARFVSVLLEEFADEWGNKWMFHYRWAREADQLAASRRLVADMNPGADTAETDRMAGSIRERMVDRVWFVGANEQTAPQIEASFGDALTILDAHLAERDYLFGARPAYADFALWAQIANADKDPTPHAIIAGKTTHLRGWLERMDAPTASGDFETWANLAGTLAPLLEQQVAALFLPWSTANADAIAAGRETFSVDLAGRTWTQKPQKYHARSLAVLKEKYRASANDALDAALATHGCLEWLK